MRLTLRTLLAYLDNVLEPDDAEQIARKISESDFASELRYRALSSSRKLQLSAPPLEATGIGHDARTVADYLDNTLPLDQVPEFERICLESDASLGEVVSCHRILMMVLEEPAQVSPELRQRIGDLILPARETVPASDMVSEQPVSMPVTLAEQREARGKPDYVTAGSRSGLGRLAMVTVLLMLMSLVGLRLAGPFDAEHAIIGGFFQAPVDLTDKGNDDALPASSLPGTVHSNQLPDPDLEQPIAVNDNLQAVNRLGSEHLLRQVGGEMSWQPIAVDGEVVPGDQLLSLPVFHPQLSLSNGIQVTLNGYCRLALQAANTTSGTVMRVNHGQLSLYNVGSRESRLELDLAGVAGVAQLPSPGSRVLLEVSHYFPPGSDPLETKPVPVVRVVCIGSARWEPLTESSSTLTEADRIGHPVYTVVDGQSPIHAYSEGLPLWAIQQGTDKSLEREAAAQLIEQQDLEVPMEVALQQQFDSHNRVEVRALAAECLAVLGQFDTLLGCWNDAEYRSHWERQVRLVHGLVASGEDLARAVQQSLARQREGRADLLYRLLQGYSPEQLEQEAGVILVEQLSDEDMDVRMLSYLNLKWMTGRSQEYRAHKVPDQQSPQIQGWRRLLKDGLVLYQQAPEPLMVLSPLAP